MKRMKMFKNRYLNYSIVLVIGLFLGWLVFHPRHDHNEGKGSLTETPKETIWTCSMHPNIRMTEPGKCPICGMDLIPLVQGGSSRIDPDAVHLTPDAAKLASVNTSRVSRQRSVREARLYGRVESDERMLQSQVAHISGRIENLNVNFTGEVVSEGQLLGSIYSPELITAQQELLEAAEMKESQPEIYDAAKEKLRQWKLTDKQISEIESSGEIRKSIGIYSNTRGVIISKRVNKGDYVSQGSVLFDIADLSSVWILFDAYESDIPFMHTGDLISFSLQALPGENFKGRIVFIDPVINAETRVAKVRVEADNRSGMLKPGMFATGNVMSTPRGGGDELVIPRSAVLWTGKRSIVYVRLNDMEEPVYKMREVELGPLLGDVYIVKEGLAEGEEIVTNGTFSVDAAAQLQGKPSMMNQTTSMAPQMGQHPEMENKRGIIHESFNVSGSCEMCKERIEKTALSVNGVVSAEWDIPSKILHLGYNSSVTSLETVQKAIAAAGHDNGKYRAPDDVYSQLPECCHYRDEKQ
jgi:Cu(I)/Ag(I) efflux system membrane fusion protein